MRKWSPLTTTYIVVFALYFIPLPAPIDEIYHRIFVIVGTVGLLHLTLAILSRIVYGIVYSGKY
jgi:hypothetical protein